MRVSVVLALAGIVVFALASSFATPAVAQPRETPGPDGNQGNLARVLQDVAVQKELELTEEQIAAAKSASLQVLEKHREDFVQALRSDDKPTSIRIVFVAVTNETFELLDDLLSPKQMTRLKQIELQYFGARALGRPNVIEALRLTDEQKKAFDEIAVRYGELMRGAFTDRTLDAAAKAAKRNALRDKLTDEIVGHLDAEQQKAWHELVGEPFRP